MSDIRCIWETRRCLPGDAIHCAIERADLIINVGHDVVEKPPFLMRERGCRLSTSTFLPRRWTPSISRNSR